MNQSPNPHHPHQAIKDYRLMVEYKWLKRQAPSGKCLSVYRRAGGRILRVRVCRIKNALPFPSFPTGPLGHDG